MIQHWDVDQDDITASQRIDTQIADLADWRGETLAHIRAVVRRADPDLVEEWKWRGAPVWSHAGMICTGETYKNAVKMTFAKGASLPDPSGLFNSSLDGNTRREAEVLQLISTGAAAAQYTNAVRYADQHPLS